ncbi:MAG: hypothetical protein LBB38_02235 [Puniceicoccales bacterium]|nr:hypothetical protein [Puniceicoccales bacterium]
MDEKDVLAKTVRSVQLGNAAAAARVDEKKKDTIPFVPSANAMAVSEARKRERDSVTVAPDGRRSELPGRSQNLVAEQKKAQLAGEFAQLLHLPSDVKSGAAPGVYVNFAKKLSNIFQRRQSSSAKKTDLRSSDDEDDDDALPLSLGVDEPDDGGDGDDFHEEGELESDEDGELASAGGAEVGREDVAIDRAKAGGSGERKTVTWKQLWSRHAGDLENYPPHLLRLLVAAEKQSKSVAEQHNLLNYAKQCAKIDVEMLGSQEAAAEKQLDILKTREDEFSKKRYERTKKLLAAIRRDRRSAEQFLAQVESAIGVIERERGDQLRDEYKIVPKARFVSSEMGWSGFDAGAELAVDYVSDVLAIDGASLFFENFIGKHMAMGFETYFDAMLKLLGADIASIDPSREVAHLLAVRQALFDAEISHQIYDSVVLIDQKLEHIGIMLERESGYYEPVWMKIEVDEDMLTVSTARGYGPMEPVKTIAVSNRSNHFAELTKLVNSLHADGIYMENCATGWGRDLFYGVRVRYGLPMLRRELPGWRSGATRSVAPSIPVARFFGDRSDKAPSQIELRPAFRKNFGRSLPVLGNRPAFLNHFLCAAVPDPRSTQIAPVTICAGIFAPRSVRS